ncbi:YcbK family protein [Aureimonas mangrovi]|uniref:YcbK family protein n=1 Tax=Aureimonas mangrovi TaxID=2758041 RepID=UPI001FE9DE65|nr:D-Ala-D-Ala carboxypeptidase family metallohydrolase [Aureimonas mangrovi]
MPSGQPRRRFTPALASGTILLSGLLILSGCVSAVDDTSAFGFTPNTSLQDVAQSDVAQSGDGAPADGEAIASVEREASGDEAQAVQVDEAAAETGTEVAAVLPGEEPLQGDRAATAESARTPSVVAFAAPNAPSRDSNRSLYASLFTDSEARTPVRNAEQGKSGRVVVTQTDGAGRAQPMEALPGVDPSSLFEIGQRASVDDEDFLDDIGGSYQVASLSGMARLAPSGFLVQREDIVTNCFDTKLVGLLQQIERRFGEKVVITSGYRSPAHNRRVRGAKASMHMACKAADLHVPGVSGRAVAEFVRALPNRGGVGTYCHTAAIHVDSGTKRDWNWACRKRQDG